MPLNPNFHVQFSNRHRNYSTFSVSKLNEFGRLMYLIRAHLHITLTGHYLVGPFMLMRGQILNRITCSGDNVCRHSETKDFSIPVKLNIYLASCEMNSEALLKEISKRICVFVANKACQKRTWSFVI
ncbi:hypothetical protein CEXT_349651 [Caerostris extrusa]|uniref:Uncharacterized protein n=1 Tax=Caerostris extrusa TaxID=172846 RepID=A0AAV4XGU0_CAEEX|nr:hypothetical protein CEXT_349651 [Caerostris extrusa]